MEKGLEAGDIELQHTRPSEYGIPPSSLEELNANKDTVQLHKLGGVDGLAQLLVSSLEDGLQAGRYDTMSLKYRRDRFGANRFKELPPKAFWALVFENLQDSTLILLMAAAAVSTVVGAAVKSQREESAYTEGVAIWIAVCVVSFVGAGNDYQKDIQFRKLNASKDTILVKVVRGAQETLIPNTEVLVGDVLMLDTGDKVVADGLVIHGHGLVIDEASLTGESEPQRKGSEDPWCRSGTQVVEGSAKVLVTAVGVHSEWGKTLALVADEAGDTPLQEALGSLAGAIGKVGLAVGSISFVVLMIRWLIENKGFPVSQIAQGPLQFFIFAVTIVVVAVPEGLPLAVTISLAYSMKKMMRDNNFVRVLAACETMGGATAICSDKTGTLTENRMTVVGGWFAGQAWATPPNPSDLPGALAIEIQMNIALNSKAFLIENGSSVEFVGNRTECALFMLLRSWEISYKTLREAFSHRIERVYGFTSERKMASVLIKIPRGFRLYTKGAAEMVLMRSESVVDGSGSPALMTAELRAHLEAEITRMASSGLRTLCLAVRDFDNSKPPAFFEEPPNQDLTLCCLLGIKDPVRKEVPDAVATCRRAGIFVRMVTGDNIHTAQCIARECGILTPEGLALEGPVFRQMPEEELIAVLPRLQVLARSSPTDKFTLVHLLKKVGEVVAVTGDGTNDAPALKESHVGLAMGIAGTEVAKQAADIIIMDDNFSSIVKTVLWGRGVFSNLRKFLQFQLTVNGVALVIAFVAAVTDGDTPLNVLELLWVNLIMDAMAALALATEDPTPDLLLDSPHGRDERLISRTMWKHIAVQACYQLAVLFLLIYGAPQHLSRYSLPTPCITYSNIDANGINVDLLNAAGGALLYNPAVPAPSKDYSSKPARCWQGPCLDMCCNVDASGVCLDNLIAQGGHYLPGETPLCAFDGTNAWGAVQCKLHRAKGGQANFCQGQQDTSSCPRFEQIQKVDNQADTQYQADVAQGREVVNSLVFNVFIFLQVFNEVNSRKIQDEWNVFSGLWRSRIFLYILVITVALQLVIMMTPVASFFRVRSQNWQEWLFAVGVGFGCMPLAWLTKLFSWGPQARSVRRRTSLIAVQPI